jgi:peptidyl-prolyl cis-trans isomerase B (cyclophilin B)
MVTTEAKEVKQKNPVAVIELAKGGKVEMELYPKSAPKTVANIVKLIGMKYYDGLTWHRVVPGFVAQTGSKDGSGTDGPGWTIKDENSPLPHDKGAVGMAKKPYPDSAGSQFYICLDAAHFLDGKYTVFGKVIKGMDLVEKIQQGDVINHITLRESK